MSLQTFAARQAWRLPAPGVHVRQRPVQLRALGEQWGVALALTMLAEFTELRADHAASIDTLTEAAARILGTAHAVRGVFDESSLDARPARAQARAALGPEAFAAAYESALAGSSYESAIALARELLPAG